MLVKIIRVINFITFISLFKLMNKCISLNVGGVEKCTIIIIQQIFNIPRINHIKFQLN